MRTSGTGEGKRVAIRPSDEVVEYLDDLVAIGIHGKTRSEVAKALVQESIAQLIKDEFLKLRTPERKK